MYSADSLGSPDIQAALSLDAEDKDPFPGQSGLNK
jgi:hypothetical protein